jgi:hypothetical protein
LSLADLPPHMIIVNKWSATGFLHQIDEHLCMLL